MRQIVAAAVGCVVLVACAVPPLVQCQLGALRVLPTDPDRATVGDARDVVRRLQACAAGSDAAPPSADGGGP